MQPDAKRLPLEDRLVRAFRDLPAGDRAAGMEAARVLEAAGARLTGEFVEHLLAVCAEPRDLPLAPRSGKLAR
jgi:hypothetical protein